MNFRISKRKFEKKLKKKFKKKKFIKSSNLKKIIRKHKKIFFIYLNNDLLYIYIYIVRV